MHRFFAERIDEKTVRLLPDEARHAKVVLRLGAGDEICVVLEDTLYSAAILDDGDGIKAGLMAPLPSPEPQTHVTLFQGLPKGEKFDFLIQKCTEAGIRSIIPVKMERCVAKIDDRDGAKKKERWQRIALEAAKQSGRTHVPEIGMPVSENALSGLLKAFDLVLVPWEDARGYSVKKALQDAPLARNIALIIGPEGGMSEEEIARFTAIGAKPVTLGRRIFRTETAGLAGLIMILQEKNEYE